MYLWFIAFITCFLTKIRPSKNRFFVYRPLREYVQPASSLVPVLHRGQSRLCLGVAPGGYFSKIRHRRRGWLLGGGRHTATVWVTVQEEETLIQVPCFGDLGKDVGGFFILSAKQKNVCWKSESCRNDANSKYR